MKILLLGSGGREHALAWKISQSPLCEELFIAPGNAGTKQCGTNVPIGVMEFDKLIDFAIEQKIDLTVVGPDDPLAFGVVDTFENKGFKIFGPTKACAQIEASKAFAKELMRDANIPTAMSKTFTDYESALAYAREYGAPIVIKASGLALGKGVHVCMTLADAELALYEIMIKKVHKDAGDTVVVEEYMSGMEISIHAISDGVSYKMFPSSQDHKRIGENDTGKNTGGMGVVAPLPLVGQDIMAEIERKIVAPVFDEFRRRGTPFRGVLYPGIMLTSDGPKVFEYNARFGDPECQVYMRLLQSDIIEILLASAEGRLADIDVSWSDKSAVNIALASLGYPDMYKKGLPISGLDEAEKSSDIVVFHAGTTIHDDEVVTNGGRVLGVSATGVDLKDALTKAYSATEKINFEGKYLRRDIGVKAIQEKL